MDAERLQSLERAYDELRQEVERLSGTFNARMSEVEYKQNKDRFSTNSVVRGKQAFLADTKLELLSSVNAKAAIVFSDTSEVATPGEKFQLAKDENDGILRFGSNATYGGKQTFSSTSTSVGGRSVLAIGLNTTNSQTVMVTPDRVSIIGSVPGKARIKLESHGSDPSTCEVGDICVSGGKLKLCTATNTWTVVGTQT